MLKKYWLKKGRRNTKVFNSCQNQQGKKKREEKESKGVGLKPNHNNNYNNRKELNNPLSDISQTGQNATVCCLHKI